MILLTHIVIALSSVLLAAYMIFRPSNKGIKTTYILTGATLVTGTYLVINSSAHILQACVTGLLFVGIVGVSLATAHARLAKQVENL